MSKKIVVTRDRPLIGIDVGWSVNRRSCAVALRGIHLELPATCYYPGTGDQTNGICVSLFTLKELTDFLPDLLQVLQKQIQKTVLVVDGPVGPNEPPGHNRYVDRACAIDGFRGRAQPSPVEGKSGSTYVAATYAIIEPFLQAAGNVRPCVGIGLPKNGLVVAETHPTVAMALMLPPQNPSLLPTRRSAKTIGDRVIRAKSDWYWRVGVNAQVASILGEQSIAKEFNHERVAGLFCLAIAAQLASQSADGSSAIAIGSPDGVYVVPQTLDEGWEAEVRRVRVVWGNVQFVQKVVSVPPSEKAIALPDVPSTGHEDETLDEYGKGDEGLMLVVADNGGVWEKHNDWLAGLEPNVVIKALNGNEEVITLRQANSPTQWKSSPSTYDLAEARGFRDPHLSLDRAIGIPVQILRTGQP